MALPFQVVLETPQLIILNKPPHLGFHNSPTAGPGVLSLLRQELGPAAARLYPVHRLDSITSGPLVFAKSPHAAQTLAAAFRDRKVVKYYVALSERRPSKKQGTVTGDMAKGRRGSWMLQRTGANPAVTKFTSGGVPGRPGLRAFLLKPETGKTHQLRVAMKALGSPVLGDARYAAAEDAKSQERGYLHCAALRLVDPGGGALRQVVVPPSQGAEFLTPGFAEVFDGWFRGLQGDEGVWFPDSKLLRSDPAALGAGGGGSDDDFIDAGAWGTAYEM